MVRSADIHPFDVLEPRKLLVADLAVTLGAITITDPGTPAELIHVATTIQNIRHAQYASGGNIHYFLSSDAALSPDDFSWDTRPLAATYNPGETANTSFDAARPTVSPTLHAGAYFVIATLEFPTGITDGNAANNTAATAETLNIAPATFQFGTVNGQQVVLHHTLANGQDATFSILGPGTGTLTDTGGAFTVTTTGTSSRSTVLIVADRNESPALGGVTINGNLLRLRLDHVAVNGNITVNGTLQALNAFDITGGTVMITSAGRSTDFRVHDLTDVTVNSAAQVGTFQLHAWRLGDAAVRDVLIAPSVNHIKSSSDFGADLAISGVGARRTALRNVDIRGSLIGGTWQVTGNAGDIDARTTTGAWAANISGNLKSLRVHRDASGLLAAQNIDTIDIKADANGLMVLAGANLGGDAHLGGTALAADTFSGATIKKVNIRGEMINSTIAAGVNPTNTTF